MAGPVLISGHGAHCDPQEWHRRGTRSPTEIDALVEARLPATTREATYADFFND